MTNRLCEGTSFLNLTSIQLNRIDIYVIMLRAVWHQAIKTLKRVDMQGIGSFHIKLNRPQYAASLLSEKCEIYYMANVRIFMKNE